MAIDDDESENDLIEEESFEEELENTNLDDDLPKYIRIEDWSD
jgi:hypothetical protein